MSDRQNQISSLSYSLSLQRVSQRYRVRILKHYLLELINNSPVSSSALKIGKMDLDKGLLGFLKEKNSKQRLDESDRACLISEIGVLQERQEQSQKLFNKQANRFLQLNDDNDVVKGFRVIRLNLKLKEVIDKNQRRLVSGFFGKVAAGNRSKNRAKGLLFYLRSLFKVKAIKESGFCFGKIEKKALSNKIDTEKLINAVAIIDRKKKVINTDTFNQLRVFSVMQKIYNKNFLNQPGDERSQIKQMLSEFDKKPGLYLSLVTNNRELKKFLLFLKVINTILYTKQRQTFGKVFLEKLNAIKQKRQWEKDFLKRLRKTVDFAVNRQKSQGFLLMKYNKPIQRDNKPGLMLLRSLFQNKIKNTFNQFYYLCALKKKKQELGTRKTEIMRLNRIKTKNYGKGLKIIKRSLQGKLLACLNRIRTFKERKKTLKVVYGRIFSLKAPKPSAKTLITETRLDNTREFNRRDSTMRATVKEKKLGISILNLNCKLNSNKIT